MFNGLNRHVCGGNINFYSKGYYNWSVQKITKQKDIQNLLAYFNLHTLRSHKSDR